MCHLAAGTQSQWGAGLKRSREVIKAFVYHCQDKQIVNSWRLCLVLSLPTVSCNKQPLTERQMQPVIELKNSDLLSTSATQLGNDLTDCALPIRVSNQPEVLDAFQVWGCVWNLDLWYQKLRGDTSWPNALQIQPSEVYLGLILQEPPSFHGGLMHEDCMPDWSCYLPSLVKQLRPLQEKQTSRYDMEYVCHFNIDFCII